MKTGNRLLDWAAELQFLSQCALTYCKDPYDRERFEKIREISLEMAAEAYECTKEDVRPVFCGDVGYQTPKMECRAAVFRENRILLVRENSGEWALPGGWIDYDQTIRTNTIKEVMEEAGIRVEPLRIIALYDHNLRNRTAFPFNICSAHVLCR